MAKTLKVVENTAHAPIEIEMSFSTETKGFWRYDAEEANPVVPFVKSLYLDKKTYPDAPALVKVTISFVG